MRSFLTLALLCALGGAEARDRHDWQSLALLKAGDRISVSLKSGPVEGAFESWTADELSAGAASAKKADVLKVQRYRQGGMGRGKHAAIGALIGFGADSRSEPPRTRLVTPTSFYAFTFRAEFPARSWELRVRRSAR